MGFPRRQLQPMIASTFSDGQWLPPAHSENANHTGEGNTMANIYTWSLMEPGTYEFDPETDQLIFDDDISASSISFSPDTIDAVFSVGGKTVILSTSPYSLTDANVTFTNGGMLLIGH